MEETLLQAISAILTRPLPSSPAEASELLRGLPGRGSDGYGTRLTAWLRSNPAAFPEPVQVEQLDHVSDGGIDILLEGLRSGVRIGIQVKSDDDLRQKGFTQHTKAQITDAVLLKWTPKLLVVILACRPTTANQQKYGWLLNEAARSSSRAVLVLDPLRAAALLKACSGPLEPYAPQITWAEFFPAAGQTWLQDHYLTPWPSVTPSERFCRPREFLQLQEAVADHPLTILVGPPATGKTFAALQILWQAYNAGRSVRWITSDDTVQTDGPVPNPRGAQNMKTRVDRLIRRLGLQPSKAPVDAIDFTAANLLPTSTVYIEDPFGKTEDAFAYSLHTYDFFDLNEFVEALQSGTRRSSCRILITSGEGLFERWLEDTRSKGISVPPFELVQMSAHSYGSAQIAAHLLKLGATLGLQHADAIAEALLPVTSLPYEAELVLSHLKRDSTPQEAEQIAGGTYSSSRERVAAWFAPASDAERLLILLMVARDEYGWNWRELRPAFRAIYTALGLLEPEASLLQNALRRYRPVLTYSPIGGLDEDDGDFSMVPGHAVVLDGFGDLLRMCPGWLLAVAKTAPGLRGKIDESDLDLLIQALVLLGVDLSHAPARRAIEAAAFGLEEPSIELAHALLTNWSLITKKAQNRLINLGSSLPGTSAELLDMAVPQEVRWRLADALFDRLDARNLPAPNRDPWLRLLEDVSHMPMGLRRRMDSLALLDPYIFVPIFARAIIRHWDHIPELWRWEVLHEDEDSTEDYGTERVLWEIARSWDETGEHPRRYFRQKARDRDAIVRINAAAAALAFGLDPDSPLATVYHKSLSDSDVRVPLGVIDKVRLIDERHRKYAETVLCNADAALAANILQALLMSRFLVNSWQQELAMACIGRGGRLAAGFMAYVAIINPRLASLLGIKRPSSPDGNEDEPHCLAWIWAYAQSPENCPELDEEMVLTLLGRLSGVRRGYAHGVLRQHKSKHSIRLRKRVAEMQEEPGEHPDFELAAWARYRLWEYPLWTYLPVASTGRRRLPRYL